MRISSLDKYEWGYWQFKTPTYLLQFFAKKKNPSLLQAAESLRTLNAWARHQQDSSWRNDIYEMKSLFLQEMDAIGFLKSVGLVRQDIKCHSCVRGWHIFYHADGTERDAEPCWHCGGTGVYKKVLLYAFTVKIDGKEFVWHQPADRAKWVHVDRWYPIEYDDAGNPCVDLDALPKFREPKGDAPKLTAWEFQKHLMGLAVFVTRNIAFEELELDGLASTLRWDVSELKRRAGRWLDYRFGRLRSVLERIGLIEETYPF